MTPQVKTSKVDQFPHLESRQEEDLNCVICNIEGVTLYWYDFDEFNLDGTAISPETHAQQGIIFHALFTYIFYMF